LVTETIQSSISRIFLKRNQS